MKPLQVAYVLWRFPCRSEQFIQRELEGLARRGVAVRLLVIGPPAAEH